MINTTKFINVDKNNGRIKMPKLTLMTKSFEKLGNIPYFSNWNISVVGNGLDEISFDVHKYVNEEKCPIWDDLEDLKVVDVNGEARFEIDVDYTDNTETVKSVHGQSLECELGQVYLYEFHVNDDDAMIYNETLYANNGDVLVTGNYSNDFDINATFVPTVFYKPSDPDHSLLHRVIKDKAPHWSIGHVPDYIALDEEGFEAELASTFQRTYTADGTDIYEFLTNEVAKESNVVFIFDTVHRIINCYSLTDGYITNRNTTTVATGSVSDNPTEEEQDDGTYLYTQEKNDIDVSNVNTLKFDTLVDSIAIRMENTEDLISVDNYSFAGRDTNDFIADGKDYAVKILSVKDYDEMTITSLDLNEINDPPTLLLYSQNHNIINYYKLYNNLTFDISETSYICMVGRHGGIFAFSCKNNAGTKVGGHRLNIQDNPDFISDIDVKEHDTLSFENITYSNQNNKPNILLLKNNRVIGNYVLSSAIEELNVYSATDVVFLGTSGATFDYELKLQNASNQFVLTTSSKDTISVEEYEKIHIKAAYIDTARKTINYSLQQVDKDSGTRVLVEDAIGEDTTVLISKDKLAQEIGIQSNKDEIKNCFRVTGGDELITSAVAVANMNGSNYIYQFADFQLNDMPEELRQKISDYQAMVEDNRDDFEALYTELNNAYEQLSYYQSVMAPNTGLSKTNAKVAYYDMVNRLTEFGFKVAVNNIERYSAISFVGITNNVKAMAEVLVDSRFTVEVIRGSTKYDPTNHVWQGQFKLTRNTDKNDIFPKSDEDAITLVGVEIMGNSTDAEELEYVKQKIMKKLEEAELSDIYFNTLDVTTKPEARAIFEQYSLNRLTSYRDAFDGCCSVILAVKDPKEQSTILKQLYDIYHMFEEVCDELLKVRQSQVDNVNNRIKDLSKQNIEFQQRMNFANYLGKDLFKVFCNYVREDEYQNDNYISDNLETTEEYLSKAKELLETAQKEIKKACVLQRTVSTSCQNMVLLPEFRELFNKFNLFNYIRVKTEDEIFRLRIVQIDFEGDNFQDIKVTFSEKIETLDGNISDTESILQQAQSISTSYSATMLQASQGSHANSFVTQLYNTGLNAAKTMITNSDSNEVTINSSGLLARRMDDTGFYGDKQLRIIGNGIYMTDDNWDSVKMAIGETIFTNPITLETYQDYGLIAPNIVGELIAGNQLIISAKNGDLVIDENGITLADDQAITFVQGGFTTVSEVHNALNGRVTTITPDAVISPNIRGGYLYIADDLVTHTSITIDPTGKDSGVTTYTDVGDIVYKFNQGPATRFNCGGGTTSETTLHINSIEFTNSQSSTARSWNRDNYEIEYYTTIERSSLRLVNNQYVYEGESVHSHYVEVNSETTANTTCYLGVANAGYPPTYQQVSVGDYVSLTDADIMAGKRIYIKVVVSEADYDDEEATILAKFDYKQSNITIAYGHYEWNGTYSVWVGTNVPLCDSMWSSGSYAYHPSNISTDDYFMVQIYGTDNVIDNVDYNIIGDTVTIEYYITSEPAHIIQALKDGQKIFDLDTSGYLTLAGSVSGGGNFTREFSVSSPSTNNVYQGIFNINDSDVKVGSSKNYFTAYSNDTGYGLVNNGKWTIYSHTNGTTVGVASFGNNNRAQALYSTFRSTTSYGYQNAVWLGDDHGSGNGTAHRYTSVRGDYINIATNGRYGSSSSDDVKNQIRIACTYLKNGSVVNGGAIWLHHYGVDINKLNVTSELNSPNIIDSGSTINIYNRLNINGSLYSTHITETSSQITIFGKIRIGQGTDHGASTAVMYWDSDERIKNIQKINDNQLEMFYKNIKPIEYTFNNDKHYRYGFGAQQIEKSLLDAGYDIDKYQLVSKGEGYIDKDTKVDDFRSVSYMDFIPLNTYMIQKLMKRVDDLENELKEIKNGE